MIPRWKKMNPIGGPSIKQTYLYICKKEKKGGGGTVLSERSQREAESFKGGGQTSGKSGEPVGRV